MIERSKRATLINASPMRAIAETLEKAAMNKEIISFGGGAPSFAPPKEVIDYVADALKKNPKEMTKYISTNGLPHTRQLISEELKNSEEIDIPAENICMTVGGSAGLFATIQAFVNPGDEVIYPDPTYLAYDPCVIAAGGKAVKIPVNWEDNFQVTGEMLNEKITDKTKMFILLTPDNPTGRVMNKENVKAIVEICEDKNILLLTDDIYKQLIYDGEFINSRKFGNEENTITCCSFSKEGSMPGFRIGYTYGSKEMIDEVKKMASYINLCSAKLSLYAVDKLLENGSKIKNEHLKNEVMPTYRKRRDAMAKYLKEFIPDLKFQMPGGAFYYFIDFNKKINNDKEFSDKLFEEKKVAVIPGRYFGENGKQHLRMTFVSEPEERIKQGIEKMAELLL